MLLDRRHAFKAISHRLSTITFLSFTLLVALLLGCQSEPKDTSLLLGKWNVYAATRNGKSTNTLKDAYFQFVNDTLLLSNILREEKTFSYIYEGDKIKVNGPLKTTYIVSQPSKDSINLYGEIKGYDFGFFTVRDTVELILDPDESPLN